jgi:pyrroline-5-carboxylate reductase
MSNFFGSVAFVGAGNMAEAIVRGLLSAQVVSAERIVAADPVATRRQFFREQLGILVGATGAEAVKGADIVFLAVKPQSMSQALADILPNLQEDVLVISIAAGVSISTIEQSLHSEKRGRPVRVIRTMPNTPMLVGCGAVAMAPGAHATPADMEKAKKLFEPGAVVIEVKEDQLDAVTALSGSGPAYFFWLVEQMTAAGIAMGLSEADATLLARQTAAGSGVMLQRSPDSAAVLRQKVTSPGGTTQAALESLTASTCDEKVKQAIFAAQLRGKELSAIK